MQKNNNTKRQPTGNLIQFPGSVCRPGRRTATSKKERIEGDERVDLNDLLLPAGGDGEDGYILDVTGESAACGVREGDKVIVDCTLLACLRDIVFVEGDEGNFTITTYRDINDRRIVGVVTHTLRAHRGWKQ